jgi:hypothetical protein
VSTGHPEGALGWGDLCTGMDVSAETGTDVETGTDPELERFLDSLVWDEREPARARRPLPGGARGEPSTEVVAVRLAGQPEPVPTGATGYPGTPREELPSGLQLVVEVWPSLSPRVREHVVQVVRAATHFRP